MPAPLSVLMVTSEAHPFAKTGGLAEVSASLTDALGAARPLRHARPASLSIALPSTAPSGCRRGCASAIGCSRSRFYERRLSDRVTRRARRRARALRPRRDLRHRRRATIRTTPCGSPCSAAPRSSTRGCASSGRRSSTPTTGSRASCRSIRRCTCRATRSSAACRPSSRCTTSRFRACFPPSTLPAIGLGFEVLDVQGIEFWGNISYLKGGINFSEKITTVSPGYAREIVQPELGFGFEGVLARRSDDLVGILNGIDTARWTPTADAVRAGVVQRRRSRREARRQTRAARHGGAAVRRRRARRGRSSG